MPIRAFRFYYHPRDEQFGRYLALTHGAFAEWFERRLEPIDKPPRRRAKAAAVVHMTFHEVAAHALRPGEWTRQGDLCEFHFVCDLSPLRDSPPIENIAKLMQFAAAMTAGSSSRRVRAFGSVLARPLSEEDRRSLAPYLTWPRESAFRKMGYEGERLEEAMDTARREAQQLYAQARYPGARPGAVVVRGKRR